MMEPRYRTKPIKNLTIFSLVGLILSVVVIVAFVFMDDTLAFKITMWVFCGIFVIIASILLYFQLFHWVELKGKVLIRHRFVFWKKVEFSNINKVINNDGLFDIYVNGKRFATISSDADTNCEMIVYMEKNGVKVIWN